MTTVKLACQLCGKESEIQLSNRDYRRLTKLSRFTCKNHSISALNRAAHDGVHKVEIPQVREAQVGEAIQEHLKNKSQ